MILLKSLLYEQITPTKQLNVLFIGDSQTASPYSYAKQLIESGIVTGDVFAKGGISMKAMLELFKLNYEPGKYDAISILGGNNDAGGTRFDQTSFKTIINLAKRDNTPVIVVTAPTMRFINKKYYPSNYPSQDAIPAWQKSLESENVSIVDAYGLLDTQSSFIDDGLHLTKNSQKLLMKAWTQVIKNIEPTIDDSKLTTDLKTEGSLRYGDIGNDVKEMQENLINLNYSVGPEANDGIFGPHTRDGVKAFQAVNKLSADGVFTTEMYELIKNDKAVKCPDSIRQQLDKKIIGSNPVTIIPIATDNQSVEKQAFALIAKFERFEATPYVDNDGIYRIGYGSSTITQEDGTIKKMGYKKTADVITQEDATRDLNRRIEDEFLPRVLSTIRKWGQEPTKFNDATIAVLTSICYNYGSLDNKSTRPTLQPHIQSGDATALANAISELRANKLRRRQEADYILNSLDNPTVKKGTTGIEKSADNTKSKPSVLKPNDTKLPTPEKDKADVKKDDDEPGLFRKAIDAVKSTLGIGVNPINIAAATVGASVLGTSAVGSNTYGIPGAKGGGEGGDWGGSMGRVLAFAKVALDTMGRNFAGSQKRGTKLTASGNISDHYLNNEIAYAVDMGVRTYEEGDQLLANLMTWFGHPEYKGKYWFNVIKDGYRYQVGWRVPDHYDHVHIGVKRVGKSKDIPVDQLNKPQQDILAANPKTPAGE
jgi:peptidoglycan hydrolase-like protein with peptidoglycan-binding domain